MKIKVMTFNIQHGRNHNLEGDVIDLSLMAETVRSQNADIVGFNEVRNGNNPDHSSGYSRQVDFFAETLGGDCRFASAISLDAGTDHAYDYGNAIFSRLKIASFEKIMIPDATERVAGYHYETRCVIKTEYDINGTRLTVLNSHFGLGPGERENAVETVLDIAGKTEGPIILMGDFNMIPDYHVIQRLSELYVDVHASMGKDELTFPSNEPVMRIDYIFARGIKALSAETVKVVAADHYPITAEFEI
ncbi:MAG: endonuclease/exonuclease/phosphatase family protein [Clostridia bacterium]|nr:endonuclease/exonuclease/phosphatase family protein [Clostridia bacterium]